MKVELSWTFRKCMKEALGKGTVHPFPLTMSIKTLVTFSTPPNHSRILWIEAIPCNANTIVVLFVVDALFFQKPNVAF